MSRPRSLQTIVPLDATGIGQVAGRPLTVSQLVQQFTVWREQAGRKAGNYPRLIRQFLGFCLEKSLPVNAGSLALYAPGKSGSQLSPVRTFLAFYRQLGCPDVAPDPEGRTLPPAANELILGYLAEAHHLRGDKTKENYAQALNAYFTYLQDEREAGRRGTFSAQTVGQYVNALRRRGLSAFTVNFYLSPVKQLTAWVIKNRNRLGLSDDQVDDLRDVQAVRGLTVERGFYKDSLTEPERDQLLAAIENPTDRAMVALLVFEGLRTVEVTRLTVGDLDFDRAQLWVRGKGRNTKKAVKLFAPCVSALHQYLQSGEGVARDSARTTPLFPGLKTARIRYRVDKYLKALDLKRPRVSAHSLRHTAGQLLIDKGIEPVWVQRHLRHELFETTQFYIRKKTEQDYFARMPDEP